jgi:hypothetical protein
MTRRWDHTMVPATDKATSAVFNEECQYVKGISRALHRRD